ncbi:MAG: replicative DNA helicase [Clostridiales bacterium]|nr:replicative DNA helicase [Clostridiales bacterium]
MSERDLNDNLAGAGPQTSYNVTEAEKAVLCLCMRSKEALENSLVNSLVPGDFVDPRHAAIYGVILDMYLKNQTVNRVSVCERLRSSPDKALRSVSDEYVYAVANNNAVISALDSYVEVVSRNSQSRKLINVLNELQSIAAKREASVNDIADMGISKLNMLKVKDESEGFEDLKTILTRNFIELKEAAFGNGTHREVKTGFSYLDSVTGGFKPGTVNVIAARPGIGKTALALNIAVNVAEMYSKTVAIFSLEMSKSEMANRILASRSRTDYKAIERATITREEEDEISSVLERLSPLPIYIDEKTDTNPVDIRAKCQELMAKTTLSLVIIDYLQLMSFPGKGFGSRQNEVAEISRSLKVLAKDLQVPVIALSQLNRGVENRDEEDQVPRLADIRESGAIEQDADCVIFIHRPKAKSKGDGEGDEPKTKIQDAQLIVAKNRHGETATCYVKWFGAKTLFFEPDRKDEPKDPKGGGSSYTAKAPQDRASSDYHFDDEDVPPEPIDDYPEPSDPDEYENEQNSDFFASDSHNDMPDGFY